MDGVGMRLSVAYGGFSDTSIPRVLRSADYSPAAPHLVIPFFLQVWRTRPSYSLTDLLMTNFQDCNDRNPLERAIV